MADAVIYFAPDISPHGYEKYQSNKKSKYKAGEV